MNFKVKLTIMQMGRSCSTCKQSIEMEVEALNAEDAISVVKELSGADPETHKFQVNYVRGVS